MDTNQDKQAQLDQKRITILYKQAGFTLIGALIGAIIIVYLMYPKLPAVMTGVWLVFALSVIPIRLALVKGFNADLKRKNLSADRVNIWERRWAITAGIPALAFTSCSYLPFTGDHLIIFLFIGLILVSMIAGSIVSSITSIKTVMVFINISILPYIARCFMESESYYWTLGYYFIAFYLVFFGLVLRMNSTVMDAIEQQIDRQDMAYKDSLTGLWNRRKLFSAIENMDDQMYSLLLIDVDHFKQFNDKKGHTKGDEMLSEISLSILRCARKEDLVIRYGGEEFLVILPGTSMEAAEKIAQEIRERVIIDSASTVSIGVADTYLEKDFDSLVELADQAMYQAKSEGRNCVRCATEQSVALKA